MAKVFLAGPIQGWERKQRYRRRLRTMLQANGYDVVDPWQRERIIYSFARSRKGPHKAAVHKMIAGDLKDIEACDLLIAYLPEVSPGASMELFYAKLKGKETVVVTPRRDVSPWIVAYADVVVRGIGELEKVLSRESVG
ncbi:MAG: nucleoside 2-deoxyribosyltransferase [Candidatus Bathyarchaeia archaeon]